ncbi:DNA mismatch repair protein MutS, core domain protein, partial [mine drainage metagenome]
HLEIRRPMNPDDPSGPTLLESMDETVTASGRRTLAFWLANPLADVAAIADRQDAVAALVERGTGVEEVRATLRGLADLARIASRVAGRRVRPPELGALRAGLHALETTRAALGSGPASDRLRQLAEALAPPAALIGLLDAALPEELPARDDAGGLFRPGHAPDVDMARGAERAAMDDLARLEATEQASTGIKSLKVAYNQVFGYYLEVHPPPPRPSRPPHFRRRQTVAQAERFT